MLCVIALSSHIHHNILPFHLPVCTNSNRYKTIASGDTLSLSPLAHTLLSALCWRLSAGCGTHLCSTLFPAVLSCPTSLCILVLRLYFLFHPLLGAGGVAQCAIGAPGLAVGEEVQVVSLHVDRLVGETDNNTGPESPSLFSRSQPCLLLIVVVLVHFAA